MPIELTTGELRYAAMSGIERHLIAIAKGLPDAWDVEDREFQPHIMGAIGEATVAKFLNVFWHPKIGAPTHGDVGGYEVKCTSRDDGPLRVKRWNPDNATYVLVTYSKLTGKLEFTIRGCMPGTEVKQDEYWTTAGIAPCFSVPQSKLYPFPPL